MLKINYYMTISSQARKGRFTDYLAREYILSEMEVPYSYKKDEDIVESLSKDRDFIFFENKVLLINDQ